MVYLSQRDPRWGASKIGQSGLEMQKFGCTTTCISMISDWFGEYLDPNSLCHNVALYTKDGLLKWGELSRIFKKFKFDWRGHGFDKARVEDAMRDPGKAVVLEVDGRHWIVGVKKTIILGNYVVVDSWDGRKKNMRPTYRKITGAAYFSEI